MTVRSLPQKLTSMRRRLSFTLMRYVMSELLRGVLLALVVFSVILMAVFAGQVIKDGIGIWTLIMVIPNLFPMICPFVLPLALITGILLCYSRLAADNEILASQAGGVRPIWLSAPAFFVAILAIFITITMNEVALTPATRAIERLVINDQANILRRQLAKPGNMTVNAGNEYIAMSRLDASRDPHNRTTVDITRFEAEVEGADGGDSRWDYSYPRPTKRIIARDHMIREVSGEGASDLSLKMEIVQPVFQDLHESDINKVFIVDGQSGEEHMPLGGRPDVTIHSNRSAFWSILTLSNDRQKNLKLLEEAQADSKNIDELPAIQKMVIEMRMKTLKDLVLRRTAEINLKLAISFSCLTFAMLGIPLGLRSKGRNMSTAFALGIAAAGGYFMVIKALELQVCKDLIPAWTMWVPNVVVFGLGVLLWIRRSKA